MFFAELKMTDWVESLISMILWQIWKSRDAFLYNHVPVAPIFQASLLLNKFWEFNNLKFKTIRVPRVLNGALTANGGGQLMLS